MVQELTQFIGKFKEFDKSLKHELGLNLKMQSLTTVTPGTVVAFMVT